MPLLEWRRINFDDAPLLSEIARATTATHIIAIDANVFFDLLDTEATHHEESQALLADWLDDLDVCVTRELKNEISRQESGKRRGQSLAFAHRFRELQCPPNALDDALSQIGSVLPKPVNDSDHSDRRQLVHAWVGGARIFATRDTTLLDHANSLSTITGLAVVRPSDAVAIVHSAGQGANYAPVRLRGTELIRRPPQSEKELLPFQRFAVAEEKAAWLASIRSASAARDRCTIEVIGEVDKAPRLAIAIDWSAPDELHIRFLRALSGSLTATLLRRALSDVLVSACESRRARVTIDDPGSGEVLDALNDLGFEKLRDGLLVRHVLVGLVGLDDARRAVRELSADSTNAVKFSAVELEAKYWPLKVVGAGIPTYVIPIQPYWAASLFDQQLADQELFGVPIPPALALENVYFSASNVRIARGSRILWYVSGKVGAVRAVSICLETITDTAAALSRKYHRLGVYDWRQILSAAHGKPDGRLRAYRFDRTELLIKPIPWSRLKELVMLHTRTRNRIPSPIRVPEGLFADVYRAGTDASA